MSEAAAGPVTRLLAAWRQGDEAALADLMPLIYNELRRLAGAYLKGERAGHTLETHDLIHEAFLRLLGQQVDWQNRAHFFAIAARMMRRILVDHARRHGRQRHGGGAPVLGLSEEIAVVPPRDVDLLALDQALSELAETDAELARIVELRFFGGMEHDEIAAVLEVSNPTVRRRWRLARAWLFSRLGPGGRMADWGRVEEVFHAVCESPGEEQENALADLADGDDELVRQVQALLAADREAGSFLELPAGAEAPPPSMIGRRLGSYTLTERLGQGGMSVVYGAVRADAAYDRAVAVKVFGFGVDRTDLLARFRTERQILASLDHPGIARLLDGGSTEEGLPYLVMERIDGVPIDRYADGERLSIDRRLALFLEVAAAVSYAHQNLVVHRDLKPSNLLVTADGRPKLLDFGIAKLLAGSAPAPFETRTGQRLLTLEYASPEQLAGGPVTTASDVYSLGVLLFVLLTGRLPYRFDRTRSGALEQAILEQEAERPSAAAREEPDAAERARARGLLPQALARRLRGDLDNIVGRALEKERGRRYPSVDALAQDLAAHLAGLPVAARPATVGYRFGKFVRRHKAAVAAGTAAALLIVGLAAAMTVQAVHLARQRDAMAQERDKALRMTRMLQEMFAIAEPGQAGGTAVTARQLLDAGARKLEELRGQPELEASLGLALGNLYGKLGMADRALPLLERSLALRRRLHPGPHADVAESLVALGELRYQQGRYAEADAAYAEAEAIGRQVGGEAGDGLAAEGINGHGAVLYERARFAEAERAFEQALALYRRHPGAPADKIATIWGNLGTLHQAQGDFAGAERFHREAIARLGAATGPARVLRLTELNNLGMVVYFRGQITAAESTWREATAEARQIYREPHPTLALVLDNLAGAVMTRGDFATAEPLAREALDLRRRLFGADHPLVALSLNNLGRIVEGRGDRAAGHALFLQAFDMQRRTLGEEHPRAVSILLNLAGNEQAAGDRIAALATARRAVALAERILPAQHPDRGEADSVLGRLLAEDGDAAAGLPYLRRGHAVLSAALSPTHWRTARAASELGTALLALGREREAEPLLLSSYQAMARGEGPPTVREATRKRLAALYEKRGQAARVGARSPPLA